jgi:hypothetical protein
MASGLAWARALTVAPASTLLGDDLGLGIHLLDEALEVGRRRLPVFVVRGHDGPAVDLSVLDRLDQHFGQHVGARADPEGVAVALRHGDGVRQGLGGQEQDLALVGVVGDREADVRQKGADQEGHVLAGHQLLGHPRGVAGGAAVIAENELDLAPAEHALGVDLVLGELHGVAIGHGESRHAAVGVEFADLDRPLLG